MGQGSLVADKGRPNEATHIFFLGVGDAFYGVANLLINRGPYSQFHRVKPDTQHPGPLLTLFKQIASTNASIASFRLSPITPFGQWHRPRKSGCRDGTKRYVHVVPVLFPSRHSATFSSHTELSRFCLPHTRRVEQFREPSEAFETVWPAHPVAADGTQ